MATTTCLMPSSETMKEWRLVWIITPWRASMRMMASWQVDGAGGHVAGVLLVAGRVGDDELALVGGEVAVGDVDGDALLALGLEAVGEQGEIDLPSPVVPCLTESFFTAASWSS